MQFIVIVETNDKVTERYGPYRTYERATKIKKKIEEAYSRQPFDEDVIVEWAVHVRTLEKWLE